MLQKHNILVFDRTQKLWSNIEQHLLTKGYDVTFSANYQDGFEQLASGKFHLVLVDNQVTETDYLELIKEIKSRFVIPVIAISHDKDPIEQIAGMEIGADDFLNMPFHVEELAVRIKALLRLVDQLSGDNEPEPGTANTIGRKSIKFGKWTLDLVRHELLDDSNNPIDLTPGEMEMLIILAESPRQALSREQLFVDTRGRDHNSFDRSVDVQISRIRQKLDNDDSHESPIKTVRGVGYMLDVDTHVTD